MDNDLVPKSLAAKMAEWRAEGETWRPHGYQALALKYMLSNPQCGLLLDPGLGKTSISLASSKILLAKRLVKRVLVVAPLRAVYEVWPDEVSHWTDFNGLGMAICHGDNKDRVLRGLRPEHQIVTINPEGFTWLTDKAERLKLLDADELIVDESSKWKNSTGVRFRALRKVLHKFRRRHILTGSPRPRHYLDLFGQIYIIDRGATLGSYVTHYRNNYFFPTGYQMREWELLPGMDKVINNLVAPLVLRLDAKDYLRLPKEMERLHKITLPESVQHDYDELESSLMSRLFTEPLTSSASARSKCAQIANGSVYADAAPEDFRAGRTVRVVHTAKVDALVDLYEELQGEPLLVSIGYHHDVLAIRKALEGVEVPCINSKTTRTQASDFVDRWNRGLLSIMLVHPASAGHALNLQKFNCRHVAVFDVPDDYDLYDQVFRRVWRQGNKSEFVMRHLFVTGSTVDVPKLANLRRKGRGQQDFLKAMREYARKKGYNC